MFKTIQVMINDERLEHFYSYLSYIHTKKKHSHIIVKTTQKCQDPFSIKNREFIIILESKIEVKFGIIIDNYIRIGDYS